MTKRLKTGSIQSWSLVPVSYTHLDVYKRQEYMHGKMTILNNDVEKSNVSAVEKITIVLMNLLHQPDVYKRQVENNNRYDEIGIFLPNSIFLKNLERHVAKAEEIIYGCLLYTSVL